VVDLITEAEAKHGALPRGSLPRRVAVVETLALDRRVPVGTIAVILAADRDKMSNENTALTHMQVLFDRMDKTVAELDTLDAAGTSAIILYRTMAIRSAYYAFMDSARYTLKPFLFYSQCRADRAVTETDTTLCTDAMRRFYEHRKSYHDTNPARTRVDLDDDYRRWNQVRKHQFEGFKKLVAERAAPIEWIERQLLEITQ
jgi:hypothetical protein